MHELSVAQGILDIVRRYVPEEKSEEVKSVKVRVGHMSGVIPESLEFCFSAIVSDTPLGGAVLDIERVPVESRCAACDRSFAVEEAAFVCPFCGGGDVQILAGMDLQVVEIELRDR